MNRHVALVGALTALALLLPTTAAVADVVVRVTSPGQDAVVDSADTVAMKVATGYDYRFECPETVRVRLLGPANDPLYDKPVDLAPQNDCEFGTERRTRNWAGASLDPRTLAPFAEDTRSCNGGYGIEATARWGDQQRVGRSHFLIQLPPSAPSGVSVRGGVERATVEWSPAPEPDVTGYRILRGDPGDPDWEIVVGPDVTTGEDTDAPAGEHEYRVATLRGDGLDDDGEALEPCTDEGLDLQAVSAAVKATVRAPATESETGSETESDTETETPTDNGPSTTETPSSRSTRTPTPTPDDEPEPEPEPVDTTERTPEPTEVESTEFEYDEQLDFSGVGPSPSDDDSDGGTVALDVPGGSSEMDQLLGPVLRPIAGGMILLVFAMHLRRWSRDVW